MHKLKQEWEADSIEGLIDVLQGLDSDTPLETPVEIKFWSPMESEYEPFLTIEEKL